MDPLFYLKKFFSVLKLNAGYLRHLGKRKTLFLALLAALTALLNSLNYVALIPLVSVVTDQSSASGGSGMLAGLLTHLETYGLSGTTLVAALGMMAVGSFIVKFLLNVLFSHFCGAWGEHYLFQVRRELIQTFDHLTFENGNQKASLVLHLNNMIPKIATFNWSSLSLVSKLIAALFLFVSLLAVSTNLALFSIAFVLIWGVFLTPVLKMTRKLAKDYTDIINKVQSFVMDEIASWEIIRVFQLRTRREQQFNKMSTEAVRANSRLSDIRVFVLQIQEFLVISVGVGILYYAHANGLKVGYLVAYGYVFSKFLGSLNEAGTALNTALEVMRPTEEVLQFTSVPTPAAASVVSKESRKIKSIEFQNLEFGWGKEPLFSIQSLKAEAGDHILIRGKNGEGKSTLLKIMTGLLSATGEVRAIIQTQSGEEQVRLPIRNWSSFYSRFSYLPQMGSVFEGTLLDNILLDSGKTEADLLDLCTKLGLELGQYFKNYKTFRVAEGGKNISGGELQIISLLRALVRDFDCLMIDEFTNHLAPDLAMRLDRYFKTLKHKIIICVSHSGVSFFNQVYVLEGGNLRREG